MAFGQVAGGGGVAFLDRAERVEHGEPVIEAPAGPLAGGGRRFIFANAITGGYKQLAEEEAKTLLDDLNEHGNQNGLKSKAQIGTVLRNVDLINKLACNKKMKEGARRANLLLGSISSMRNTEKSGNPSMDLSRGDYKISDSVFRKEIDEAGFFVDQIHTIGPVENIGGFSVYLLRKS